MGSAPPPAPDELDLPATRSDLRALVETYASAVDHLELDAAAALFTVDAVFTIPDVPTDLSPVVTRRGRDEIRAGFEPLHRFLHTFHAVVGHTIAVEAGAVTGRTTCLAHHLGRREEIAVDSVWHCRYDDVYAQVDGQWRFASRALRTDWIETRPVGLWRDGR